MYAAARHGHAPTEWGVGGLWGKRHSLPHRSKFQFIAWKWRVCCILWLALKFIGLAKSC